MAIYHFSVKPIQRSKGRTATAAAAYRAGCQITDERTGEIHDYRRRSGVISTEIFVSIDAPAWAQDRASLWNAAEDAEKRKDGTPAREYEVALPHELNEYERRLLVSGFCCEMVELEGCAIDVAIHEPGKSGDLRNHHAHILRTTRRLDSSGFGQKLDTEKAGRNRSADLESIRARWAHHCNRALELSGHSVRVDHRSHTALGLESIPSLHNGPTVTSIERRKPGSSWIKREREEARDGLKRVAQKTPDPVETSSSSEERELERAIAAAQFERVQQQRRQHDERELARWKSMSVAELAAEIQRLRPPPISSQIVLDDDVRKASDRLGHLRAQHDQVSHVEREISNQIEEWREKNPRRAWLHDKGVGHAPYLREREEKQALARQKLADLAPNLEAVQIALRDAEGYARERIRQEQESTIIKLDTLEQVRLQRVQEAMELDRIRNFDLEKRNAIRNKNDPSGPDF